MCPGMQGKGLFVNACEFSRRASQHFHFIDWKNTVVFFIVLSTTTRINEGAVAVNTIPSHAG